MKRIALFVAALLAAGSLNAQIYQWKDENGKTVLSDKPPVGHANNLSKKVDSSAPEQGGKQKTLAERDMEFRKRQKDSQEAAEKTKKKDAESAVTKENCETARRQIQTLESGERIARHDDKGERYFLEDDQREQEIAKIRNFLQSSCK